MSDERGSNGAGQGGVSRSPGALPGELPQLKESEFEALRSVIHRESGIFLSDAKRALLASRLGRRLRALGLRSYGAYHDLVVSDPTELVECLNDISTNETRFFREPAQFELLRETVLPAMRGQRVRAWCAACSTGEEPYSLAMTMLDVLGDQGEPPVEVLASDLSTNVLNRAAAAVYPASRVEPVPERLLRRYMLRGFGPQEGNVRAGPLLRSVVRFRRINLNEPLPADMGSFELVFCRNVLIYFNQETKRSVLARLVERLAPGGLLFLGHAESAFGLHQGLRAVGPMTYQLVEPAGRGRP